MRALVAALVLTAACSVPDKQAITGDGGVDAPPDAPDDHPGPPDTVLLSGPPEFTNAGLGQFEFTASKATATFVCSIDGETPSTCSSPYSRSLADGPHTFSVRATDRAGQSDDTPAEHLWSIDTVSPDTMLVSTPPAADNSATVRFEFASGEENVVFQCSLDGGEFFPCVSGAKQEGIVTGPHAFAVRAHDRAGNLDSSPATFVWTVDLATPDTQITSAPPLWSAAPSAVFAFGSNDAGANATFECKLDGGAFVACTSPRTVSGLADGEHTFAVRVTDAVGNVDPSPATRTWHVDRVAPDTLIQGGPMGTVITASANFAFSATEAGATFTCALDGAAAAPCTSPASYTGLAQGAHTFTVRARDLAGNEDATPASRTWTIDTEVPTIVITDGPGEGTTSGPRVRFAFTVSEGTPQCSLDGAAFAACTSPFATNLSNGEHTFAIRATDGTGNTGMVTRTWTVACVAPATVGAAGLLHLDTADQVQPNAVTGGAPATLGSTDQVETADPTPVMAGRYGAALAFTASDGDHVVWPVALGTASGVAIELWALADSSAGTRDILTAGTLALRVARMNANKVRFTLAIGAASVDTALVDANAWHHLAITTDGTTAALYVDGVRSPLTPATAAPITLDTVELSSADAGSAFGGQLDEVWLATSAFLSDDAALANYCPL